MGACYSLFRGRRNAEHEEVNVWWRDKDERRSKKSSLEKLGGSSGGGGGAAAADALLQIPGRLFGNGACSTASLYTQQGKKGTNQDAMIVWENFSSRCDTVFCGVFDGHGPYGHMVSKQVRDSLPVLVCSEWKANSNSDHTENRNVNRTNRSEECMDDDCESLEVEGAEKLPEIYLPLKKSILKAFRVMDKELKLHAAIDCFFSGTTAVTLVKQCPDLILGNVGDSRAVLATRDKDNALTAVQLTVDLKPNLPREAARIQQCKGRVFALQDEPEVARVWLPNSDSPGLAMARAFGDFCLKDFDLISVPDVYYHHLTERDEFVVLATDGVWDVLSNKEAVDIIALAPGRATAARALVDCATRAWRLKYPTSKTDDCAVVCLFLDRVQPPNAAPARNDSMVEEALKILSVVNGNTQTKSSNILADSGTFGHTGEIVPVLESPPEERFPLRGLCQSKRSLAECLSKPEDEDDEWSALEGITRVNSLLSIPRLFSGDIRSSSWRKWL